MTDFTSFTIKINTAAEISAAEILADEIQKRTEIRPSFGYSEKTIAFCTDSRVDRDSYIINPSETGLIFSACGIRGFVYAIGMFLRKTVYRKKQITLIDDICGRYTPYMKIRGHQLGWRDTSNTYEAWTPADYYDYIKDLMFFGCNTFEHTVFEDTAENRNSLMRFSQREFIRQCNEKAKKLDIDISYWYPNDEKDDEVSADIRREFFAEQPYADIYFPPGSDPGDFEADVFMRRTLKIAEKIKEVKPNIQIYPSAQSPDGFGKWGDVFIEEMQKMPPLINGVITGPNCAMELHDLRKRLPLAYPIRLYPDITHNVRCEYPVHFDRDDWHYALASTLSRESVNPRPTEYRRIHRLTRHYVSGSVTYSEGINDDINKFVWSDMDFFPDVDLRDTLADYARLFFYGADTEKVVNGILGLEKNWEGDPQENPHIECTAAYFDDLAAEDPSLLKNVRFLLCLFRAKCDLFVKQKRTEENILVQKAKKLIKRGELDTAEEVLCTSLSQACLKLRSEIDRIGEQLFKKVGYQLNTAQYGAKSWERGATLDTIDNPVTDRLWLLNRIQYAKRLPKQTQWGFLERLLNRNQTSHGCFCFSFAENSLTELGVMQKPHFYMDFQGDRPHINNGCMPMSMVKVFDHYSFSCKAGGLIHSGDYALRLHIKPRYNESVTDFTVKINGEVLYKGKQYGGTRDDIFEKELSAPGFEARVYRIPAELIENGCVEIEITEPKIGIMLSELFLYPFPDFSSE